MLTPPPSSWLLSLQGSCVCEGSCRHAVLQEAHWSSWPPGNPSSCGLCAVGKYWNSEFLADDLTFWQLQPRTGPEGREWKAVRRGVQVGELVSFLSALFFFLNLCFSCTRPLQRNSCENVVGLQSSYERLLQVRLFDGVQRKSPHVSPRSAARTGGACRSSAAN